MTNGYPSLPVHERRLNSTAIVSFDELVSRLEQSADAVPPATRRTWIRTLLLDLGATVLSPGKSTWTDPTIERALVGLKLLGRSVVGTDDLGNHLTLLLRLANLLPASEPEDVDHPLARHQFPSNIVIEALRVIANTLFLHPLARTSSHLNQSLKKLVLLAFNSDDDNLNDVLNDNDEHEHSKLKGFLAARVLFLITAAPSSLVIHLVQDANIANHLAFHFAGLRLQPYLANNELIIEFLKLIFNLMVNYPASLAKFPEHIPSITPQSLPPSNNSSPVKPSIKQRLVSQINLKKISKRINPDSPKLSPCFPSPTAFSQDWPSSKPGSPAMSPPPDDQFVSEPQNVVFAPLLPHLVQLFLLEPIPDPPSLKPPLRSYMHTFLNFSPSAYPFFSSRYRLPDSSDPLPPVIAKLIAIIDRVTAYYCPDNPDERAVREKCEADTIELDVDLTQVLLLTANLVSPSSTGGLVGESRKALRDRLVPADIDRNIGLHKQDNLVGRILRLMNSVGYDSLKITCGGFLLAAYDQDADFLASQIGYGPLAGYFLSIGKPGLNPDSKHAPPPDVNPITGTYWSAGTGVGPADSPPASPVMTDAEREAEAERLCGLFDRMNRTGVISVADPRRTAVESGRFEEVDGAMEEAQRKEEEKEEEEAVKELMAYRERRKPKKNEAE